MGAKLKNKQINHFLDLSAPSLSFLIYYIWNGLKYVFKAWRFVLESVAISPLSEAWTVPHCEVREVHALISTQCRTDHTAATLLHLVLQKNFY